MDEKRRIYSEIGRMVQRRRLEKGLTQEALGLAVGLSRTSITNLEKGRQGILVHNLFEIASELGVSAASLLPEYSTEPVGEQDALSALLKSGAVTKKEAAFVKKALQQ